MLNLTPKMILFVLPSILVTVLENLLVTYIVFVFGFTVTLNGPEYAAISVK